MLFPLINGAGACFNAFLALLVCRYVLFDPYTFAFYADFMFRSNMLICLSLQMEPFRYKSTYIIYFTLLFIYIYIMHLGYVSLLKLYVPLKILFCFGCLFGFFNLIIFYILLMARETGWL